MTIVTTLMTGPLMNLQEKKIFPVRNSSTPSALPPVDL
jgi:hypothetical protein